MKQIFIAAFLMLLMSYAVPSMAQAYGTRTTGKFTLTSASGTAVTASYSLMPAAPSNLVLQIVPSAAFTLTAHITDSKGREVMKLNTADVTLRYVNSIDVSKLPAGNYYIEILHGRNNALNYRIPFTR